MIEAREEYLRRLEAERHKALTKYGEEALQPGGNPDLDALDYAINELVGLGRYGEMIQARARDGTWPSEFLYRGVDLGFWMTKVSKNLGRQLIALRQALLARGVELGEPERR